ncbi:MAG: triose-phosphate isomerase [Pseudomonadota bacterium]
MNANRNTLIAGNWKMNGSRSMVDELIPALTEGVPRQDRLAMLVLPPFPYLSRVVDLCHGSPIQVGAQDLSTEVSGAFTGEVSAAMLVDQGVSHVLVGHSERREYHREDDATVARKFEAALQAKLIPILCVGETLAERESGLADAVIQRQLAAVLDRVGISAFTQAVVAYEPVWAIGTGQTATPDQAQAIHAMIRSRLNEEDDTIAGQLSILYGGSMKPQNAAELLGCDDIDGGLIGGAALKADDFLGIAQAVN